MTDDSSTTLSVEEILKTLKREIISAKEKETKAAINEQAKQFAETAKKVDALLSTLSKAQGLSNSTNAKYAKSLEQSGANLTVTEDEAPIAAPSKDSYD